MSPNQRLDPSLLLDQAVACHRKGQLAEAERLYLKALELNPRLSAAYRLLGFIRSQQGRNAEALAHVVEDLLDVAPEVLRHRLWMSAAEIRERLHATTWAAEVAR